MHNPTPRRFVNAFRLVCCLLWLAGCGIALAAEPDALTTSILGDWLKNTPEFKGDSVRLNSDGTFKVTSQNGEGTWKWVNKESKRFEVTHESGDAYILTLSQDGTRATGEFVRGEARKIGKPVEFVRKNAITRSTPAPNPPPSSSQPVFTGSAQEITAKLVKTHRNNLVFVSGTNGSGSGFLAKFGNRTFLFTNAHVAAGVQGAAFKTLQGDQVQVGTPSVAVGHDIFLMQAAVTGQPLEIMTGVDENASIGDEIVVLGNAEGAGVINTITGRIVGVGPNLVEVDAPFLPGNSGSPIILPARPRRAAEAARADRRYFRQDHRRNPHSALTEIG